MSEKNTFVAICNTHAEAEQTIKKLQKSGYDMKKLSIVGKDSPYRSDVDHRHTDHRVLSFQRDVYNRRGKARARKSVKLPPAGHGRHLRLGRRSRRKLPDSCNNDIFAQYCSFPGISPEQRPPTYCCELHSLTLCWPCSI